MTEHNTLRSIGATLAALAIGLTALMAVGVGGAAADEVTNQTINLDEPEQESVLADINITDAGDDAVLAIRSGSTNVTTTTVTGVTNGTVTLPATGLSPGDYHAAVFADDPTSTTVSNVSMQYEQVEFVEIGPGTTDIDAELQFDASQTTNYTVELINSNKSITLNSTTGTFDPVDYNDGEGWVDETFSVNNPNDYPVNLTATVTVDPASAYESAVVEEDGVLFGLSGIESNSQLFIVVGIIGVGYLYYRSRDDMNMGGGGGGGGR
jgi:hypothetical protein